MFTIKVKGNIISVQETEPITSGSVSVYKCRFTFDNSWEGFFRSAVFRCGSMVKTVPLDAENMCDLPWELLEKKHIGLPVEVSIYGSKGETEILPTIWDKLGRVRKGSEPGDDVQRYSPSVYERIVSLIKAYSDKTKGDKGDKGDPGEGDMNAAVYDPRGKATDIFAYVNDSAASKIHASQHSAAGSDPITPEAIGAVSRGGDTMIGNLHFSVNGGVGALTVSEIGVTLEHDKDGKVVYTQASCDDLSVKIGTYDGTAWKTGTVLHTGNKPSGSYTGNSDATMRTIETGGIGNVCAVYRGGGFALVTYGGALCVYSSGDTEILNDESAYFSNGILCLKTDNAVLNHSGSVNTYQVL